MYLIFDTETTGLPRNYNAPISDSENWPRAVQIAWQLHNEKGALLEHKDFLMAILFPTMQSVSMEFLPNWPLIRE